jgi:hypothetical protein
MELSSTTEPKRYIVPLHGRRIQGDTNVNLDDPSSRIQCRASRQDKQYKSKLATILLRTRRWHSMHISWGQVADHHRTCLTEGNMHGHWTNSFAKSISSRLRPLRPNPAVIIAGLDENQAWGAPNFQPDPSYTPGNRRFWLIFTNRRSSSANFIQFANIRLK